MLAPLGQRSAPIGHRTRADLRRPAVAATPMTGGEPVFTHTHALQFEAKPDGPDPDFARKMQEVLGGEWGEMTVATQYLLQGWNCRLPGKYKDMLLAIGTEELAHVEMIVTMIDRLLDHQPLKPDSADRSKETAAGYGQTNPQHAIVNGGGAYYRDSMGLPWSGGYVTASGNLMADFHYNATAEMQGRLQVSRLYNMTDDPGVKDLLRFLLPLTPSPNRQGWARAGR